MGFASALAGVSMGASAMGSVLQGEGEAQSADYMSQVAANNVSSKWLSWQNEGGTPSGSNPIMTMSNGMMING